MVDALGRWSLHSNSAGNMVRVRRANLHNVAACAMAHRRLSCLRTCAPAKAARLIDFGTAGLEFFAVYEASDFSDDLASMLSSSPAMDLATFTPLASQILAAVEPLHTRATTIGLLRPIDIRVGTRDGRALHVMIQDLAWISPHVDEPAEPDAALEALVAPEGIHESLASDVYALGALFGRMLSGHWPTSSRVAWPADAPPPVPLMALVEEMLAGDPTQRPADAGVVMERLVVAVPAKRFALPRVSSTRPPVTNTASSTSPTVPNPTVPSPTVVRPTVPSPTARVDTPRVDSPRTSDSAPVVDAQRPAATQTGAWPRVGGASFTEELRLEQRGVPKPLWIAGLVMLLSGVGIIATCDGSANATSSVTDDAQAAPSVRY